MPATYGVCVCCGPSGSMPASNPSPDIVVLLFSHRCVCVCYDSTDSNVHIFEKVVVIAVVDSHISSPPKSSCGHNPGASCSLCLAYTYTVTICGDVNLPYVAPARVLSQHIVVLTTRAATKKRSCVTFLMPV